MTKEEIIDQLKKNGINDLDQLADFVLKNAKVVQGNSEPIVNSAIVVSHGFVSH